MYNVPLGSIDGSTDLKADASNLRLQQLDMMGISNVIDDSINSLIHLLIKLCHYSESLSMRIAFPFPLSLSRFTL